MQGQMPETTNFRRQAERNAGYEGVLPISRLERLQESLNSDAGELIARVAFGRDAGVYTLKGSLEAELEVTCQRCMQTMSLPVATRFVYALVTSADEIEALPKALEPYLIEGEEQSLIDLLEDELILALPMVSTHQQPCSEFLREQDETKQADKESSSPFAVLKNLMTD